ncbi:ARP6-like protein, partial [Mya arenaria]
MVVVVLDNGAAKNVRTRIFIGDQIDECKDLSGLYYLLPFQKVDFSESSIILTEPYFNFQSIQEGMNEILFEEYGFQSAFRTNPAYLSQYKLQKDTGDSQLCALILDTGYSFSHIVPYCKGEKLKESVVRQLMVMDETYVINQLKEDVSYKGAENTVMRDYVLPDYTHITRGYVRPREETTGKAKGNEQIIRMNNERFSVPELLFHPSDVGVHEKGITEALVHSVSTTPEEMHPHLYRNILTTGGNCLFPGFDQRFYTDVRSMAPDEFDISVTAPKKKLAVTRAEYEEHGHNICMERFD